MSRLDDYALQYVRRRWAPIPIPEGQKGPRIKKWQNLRLTEADVPKCFNGVGNVGVILGKVSDGLTDCDLDCREAVELAPKVLPETGTVFGRAGKPRSHYLYRVSGSAPTTKFLDPITGSTLLELRGDGGLQTLFPPSIHPSGERVEWAAYGEPKTIASAELITRTRFLAACCLIRRYCGGVTGAAGVFAALDAVDRHVADRIRDWLGLAGATFGAQKSKATYDFFPSLGDPPPYLASLPKRRLDEAALRSLDFAPASASRIADQCRQLAQFRDTKGNIAEPLWYAGLCVLTRCVEGERIAHEWSSGPPGYSVTETQKKFAPALRDSGPTTCARFESLNPEGCKDCPHKGSIKSPIVLGLRDDPTTGANNDCNDGRSDRSERATPGRAGVNENVEEQGPMNEGVTLEDFYAYMPTHSYIFAPSRELWPASSVNARVRPPSEVARGSGCPPVSG
jgi:hypothetical protein